MILDCVNFNENFIFTNFTPYQRDFLNLQNLPKSLEPQSLERERTLTNLQFVLLKTMFFESFASRQKISQKS